MYRISKDCMSCGICSQDCPVGAIYYGDVHYIIDGELCIDCGNCEQICPVGAPYPVETPDEDFSAALPDGDEEDVMEMSDEEFIASFSHKNIKNDFVG